MNDITYTAYLNAYLDTTGKIPRVMSIKIFSAPARAITTAFGKGVYAEILRITSHKSYQDASDSMLEFLMDNPSWKWVRPWVDPSWEAHQARYDLLEMAAKGVSREEYDAQRVSAGDVILPPEESC